MARPEELLEVGRVTRAHGLQGEVVVKLITNRTERLSAGSVLWADDRALEVQSARQTAKGWLVSFAGVTDRDAAEELRGLTLRAPAIDDPDELWVHDLLGGSVIDQDGVERGVVESVEANPASDLLVLDNGALVPARFVTSVSDGRIEVDVPPGLFESA